MPQTRRRTGLAVLLTCAAAGVLVPAGAGAASLDLESMTLAQLHAALLAKRTTCTAIVTAELGRITAYDHRGPALDAIISVNPEALADAAVLDARQARGDALAPAHCTPIVVKDNIDTEEVRTTGGSELFSDYVPDADAPAIARMREQGAIVLGKGNLDDFAAAVYGVSSIAGAIHNPYGLGRTVGGSSGGPAASVAAGYVPLAVGTDAGGSLRIPSAFDSLVTIRPTIGLVSRTGVMPRTLTQDTAGPIARTVADAAEGLDLMAGYDPADPVTARGIGRTPVGGYAGAATGSRLDGMRIGLRREGLELFGGNDPAIDALTDRARADLERVGATVVDIPAPTDALLDSGVIGFESKRDFTAYLQAASPTPPVSTFQELYDSGSYTSYAKEAYDREVGVDTATLDTNPDYLAALRRQQELRDETLQRMAGLDLDAIAYPSQTRFPDLIGVEQSGVFSRWSENTGFPALGVPMGFGGDANLPASLELLGRPFDEATLIHIASAYERAAPRRRAPASTPPTTVALADVPTTPTTPTTPTVPSTPTPTPTPAPVTVTTTTSVPTPVPVPVPVTTAAAAPLTLAVARLRLTGGRALRFDATTSEGSGLRVRVTRARSARTLAATKVVTIAAGAGRPVALRLTRHLSAGRYRVLVTARAGQRTETRSVPLRVR